MIGLFSSATVDGMFWSPSFPESKKVSQLTVVGSMNVTGTDCVTITEIVLYPVYIKKDYFSSGRYFICAFWTQHDAH